MALTLPVMALADTDVPTHEEQRANDGTAENAPILPPVNLGEEDEEGNQFHVEMQIITHTAYKERTLKYTVDKYSENYKREELRTNPKIKYTALRPVYSINIMLGNIIDDNQNLHIYTLYDVKNKQPYTQPDLITIAFLEIEKANTTNIKNIEMWRKYFKQEELPEDAPYYIKEAAEIIRRDNLSKEEHNMLTAREKAIDDYEAFIYTIEHRGIEKGREEGKLTITKTLLDRGYPIEEVAEISGIPIEQLQDL